VQQATIFAALQCCKAAAGIVQQTLLQAATSSVCMLFCDCPNKHPAHHRGSWHECHSCSNAASSASSNCSYRVLQSAAAVVMIIIRGYSWGHNGRQSLQGARVSGALNATFVMTKALRRSASDATEFD
jgi:hypothetical protein